MTTLTLAKLTALTRSTWSVYAGEPGFDAAASFNWPGPLVYLFPNITPALFPDGATTPLHLLQALVARHALPNTIDPVHGGESRRPSYVAAYSFLGRVLSVG